jgi:hypothetical protein
MGKLRLFSILGAVAFTVSYVSYGLLYWTTNQWLEFGFGALLGCYLVQQQDAIKTWLKDKNEEQKCDN